MTRLPPRRSTAFTLIELLVVIAIIAVIIGILLPALGGARERAKSLKCQTDQRELVRGCLGYSLDWNVFPPCLDNYAASANQSQYNNSRYGLDWLGIGGQSGTPINPGDQFDPNSGNPRGFAAAPRFGLIYKYTRNDNLILCPSDTAGGYQSNQLVTGGNGKFSYTMMSAGVSMHAPDKIPADNTPLPSGNQTRFQGTTRSAAFAPVFLEEHPDGINNTNVEGNFGAFRGFNMPPPNHDGDHLVARHGPIYVREGIRPGSTVVTQFAQGRSNIGFADGHVDELLPNFGFDVSEMQAVPGYNGLPNYIGGILYHYGVKFEVLAFDR